MTKLSEARRTISGMFPDPWKRLADDWPNVTVKHVDLGERWEYTVWHANGRRTVNLHRDLLQIQRRAALTHALEHLERGAPCDSLRSLIEQQVCAATARWLIPDIVALAAAVAAYNEVARVAHELWVPPHVLQDRMDGLTHEEWVYIEKHREGVA